MNRGSSSSSNKQTPRNSRAKGPSEELGNSTAYFLEGGSQFEDEMYMRDEMDMRGEMDMRDEMNMRDTYGSGNDDPISYDTITADYTSPRKEPSSRQVKTPQSTALTEPPTRDHYLSPQPSNSTRTYDMSLLTYRLLVSGTVCNVIIECPLKEGCIYQTNRERLMVAHLMKSHKLEPQGKKEFKCSRCISAYYTDWGLGRHAKQAHHLSASLGRYLEFARK
jgi:hypothetical protein